MELFDFLRDGNMQIPQPLELHKPGGADSPAAVEIFFEMLALTGAFCPSAESIHRNGSAAVQKTVVASPY